MALSVRDLTQSINEAFKAEWPQRKPGIPLPTMGAEDRELLFAAVARGLLSYLKSKEGELLTSITIKRAEGSTTETVERTALNIEAS